MDIRGTRRGDHVDGGRRPSALTARTAPALRDIVRRARGWACDVAGAALDDQSAKLHLPFVDRADIRPLPTWPAAGELVVARIEEFVLDGAATTRWFELDSLVYDPNARRLSVASEGRIQFVLTVESLDVVLRSRPQARPHP